MWVLDLVGADTTYYLVAGEWSVGRKRCHFNFHADGSISRTHALIRVGSLSPEQLSDPSSRPSLELVDQDSRFGSFVNQDQCFGARRLRHGDEISFGAKRTVLRVRYQVFVLVASRIQRASRTQVNETCQRIGMHLVAAESQEATHCIMDPGKIVATVKVLWALVYNQPVVCTPWIYAILNRSSLAEPLPRCEDFLPSDPTMPEVETNYLPNPSRKTLFRGFVVVFLMPQSMQDLVAAMDGEVIKAYQGFEEDEQLIRELEKHVPGKQVLFVEPAQSSGFSNTGQQSERVPAESDLSSSFADVERRVELFRSMGAVFTSVPELAGSVIYAKPPTAANDNTFCNNLANFAGSSVQMMSFPEHLSLRSSTNTSTAEGNEDEGSDPAIEDQEDAHESEDDATSVNITIKEDSQQMTDSGYEELEVTGREDTNFNIMQIPIKNEPEFQKQVPSTNIRDLEASLSQTDIPNTDTAWISSRDIQPRDVKPDFDEPAVKPRVVSCALIVKKRAPVCRNAREGNGLVNYKRFKKGNGVGTRTATASLFPKQTVVEVSVTVDNPEREVLQENLAAMEEEERIAEELFAMGEGRATKSLFG